ncbi:hypothetical protein E5K00_00920 [Hymenobacter aquaticus]|uniref:Uncharacterized protein n=1 Tax=Hymenobacter aquaticus TaxID=1867101 RepID=A0A4Z0Q2V2_9BACT|nr:hypothetical protein [Hymenobacter aquaticus]TGE23809.1 hypothetical protein E5K00_00920 [Hymenobacter aquaticus]
MNLRQFLLPRTAAVLLTSASLLSGCGPSYYLAVQPSHPDSQWPDGRQAVSTNFDQVEVQVCYSHLRNKELMFEVEVRNGSDSVLTINPASFYYIPKVMDRATAKQNGVKLNGNVIMPSAVYAVDPEARIQQLSAKLDKEARKANGVSALELLTVVTNVAEDLKPVQGTPQEKQIETWRREDKRANDAAYFDDQRMQHAQNADNAYLDKSLWEVKVLRKNTLRPGELARGYVTFPSYEQTALLRLALPLAGRTLFFDFDQERKKNQYEPVVPPAPLPAPVPPTATTAP